MMNESVDEKTKNKIIGIISVLIPQAKIYLFGSRARGKFSRFSDIDIALDARQPLSGVDVDEVKRLLNESNILTLIDVLDFHSVSSSMQEQIIKDRIIWKS